MNDRILYFEEFRSDLYFRISTLPLTIPALRERPEDILIMARALLERLSAERRREPVSLMPDAECAFQEYTWPGNIRELRNVLERAVLLTDRSRLTRCDLCFDLAMTVGTFNDDSDLTLLELERLHIERVLRAEHGHVARAAARLGIPRSSLYQKIKRYDIDVSRY
jgi:DNA-binding NtrC family response regulator